MDDLSSADRMDGVVPVAVKPMGREAEGGEVFIGDGAALRIPPAIQLAPHAQAGGRPRGADQVHDHRSEEHTSELQSLAYLVCRLLLEKKKNKKQDCTGILETPLCSIAVRRT